MNVAIYMLTRDRLEYTRRALRSLVLRTRMNFSLSILDNGSTDGTQDYLSQACERNPNIDLHFEKENIGIHAMSKIAQRHFSNFDLVFKVDNDCEFTHDVITPITKIYDQAINKKMILSPRVEGIVNQPRRIYTVDTGDHKFGMTGHVGGLCMAMPNHIFSNMHIETSLPKAKGFDSNVCSCANSMGYTIGYIEDLSVWHMDGTHEQAKKYPEYFKRKMEEEK